MKIRIYIVCIFFSCVNFTFATPTQWQRLAPGLQYAQIYPTPGFPLGAIHAFKINLKAYDLDLAFTGNNKRPLVLVKDLVLKSNAVIGINGGFFSPKLVPLGLRIKNGKLLSPIKHTSWWGVFYIKNNRPYIVPPKGFHKSRNISFAVQSGPRLVINGKIPSLKPGWSFRSALGITKGGSVIIAITNHMPMTTNRFATILKAPESKGGLNCRNALNLDGGSSSQLFAQVGSFSLTIPSLAPVADAVLVIPKS